MAEGFIIEYPDARFLHISLPNDAVKIDVNQGGVERDVTFELGQIF